MTSLHLRVFTAATATVATTASSLRARTREAFIPPATTGSFPSSRFASFANSRTRSTFRGRRALRAALSDDDDDDDDDRERGNAEGNNGEQYYEGMYGRWSVSKADEIEVWSYRVALSLACAGASGVVLGGFTGNEDIVNPSYFAGASGLGVALVLVHMYVTPIKRVMQALYAVGFIGSVGIAASYDGGSLLDFVVEHRSAVWLIGPLFAAFTGLAFKEGACYGKPEAFFLFLMTPIMCLGHLTGLASGEVETFFVATWMLGFLVFAGRKYTQAVKDDIGDKSVFTFRGLKTDEERRDYLEKQGKDLSLMDAM
jgi:uncharacterized integral membrane protein